MTRDEVRAALAGDLPPRTVTWEGDVLRFGDRSVRCSFQQHRLFQVVVNPIDYEAARNVLEGRFGPGTDISNGRSYYGSPVVVLRWQDEETRITLTYVPPVEVNEVHGGNMLDVKYEGLAGVNELAQAAAQADLLAQQRLAEEARRRQQEVQRGL